MPSMYQPGIPTGSVPLLEDYKNLKNNFLQLDTTFGVDHLPFSDTSNQNGYHGSIHFNPVSTLSVNPSNPENYPPTPPPTTVGYGQLFSAQINDGISAPDTALYWLSGGGILTELTRNVLPVGANNGYSYLAGGILLQWGITGLSTNDIPVVFSTSGNKAFPKNLFNVQVTAIRAHGTFTTDFSVTGQSRTGFTIVNSNSGTTSLSYYWQAIGN